MRTSSTLLFGLSLSFLLACGDSGSGGQGGTGGGEGGTAPEGGGGGSVGGSPSTGGGDTGGAPVECEAPTPMPGDKVDVPVETVTISAKDETGSPISDTPLQLCGTNGCLYATTSAIGQALFTNNLSSDTIDRPLVKPGDSLVFGKIGYHYTEGAASPFPVTFPRMEDSGEQITAGGTVSASGVTLEVGANAHVTFDSLIYDTEDKQTFRAAQLPAELIEAATGDASFSMVYTLGPVDTLFCDDTVTVTFDNYADLPADATVDIFGHELAIGEEFGPYGEWTKIAEGKVSADGTTITTAGEGLPVLLTVAIRAQGQ
ncbi:MAG: hypothetical protein HOW73_36380 [Polyangiaceae bacterium]|nr:hypothetical protein [Polyangiaceae bacterium]